MRGLSECIYFVPLKPLHPWVPFVPRYPHVMPVECGLPQVNHTLIVDRIELTILTNATDT